MRRISWSAKAWSCSSQRMVTVMSTKVMMGRLVNTMAKSRPMAMGTKEEVI